MAEEHDQGSKEKQPGPEGERILPGEWLRRLAERRIREEKGREAGAEPPPQEAPSSAPAQASAAGTAEEARRQLREEAERARSGVESLLAAENQRLTSELVSAVSAAEQRLQQASDKRVDAEISRLQAAVDEAVRLLREEGERQRAEYARQAAREHERLAQAGEQTRRLAEAQIRADTERILDDLLVQIRGIGQQAS